MKPFAVVIRCGQPFDHDTLVDIGSLAPINGYIMLDTIAMDCLQLDNYDLHSLWLDFIDTTSLIAYNSWFTADQFKRRFDVPEDVVQLVSRCSTDVSEYVNPLARRDLVTADTEMGGLVPEDRYILVVGNHFPHKNIAAVITLLHEIATRPNVIVLGVHIPEADGIVGYRSGELEQAFVNQLYENASLLLFPTHYEGFGLPIMHALAHRLPVVARDLPLFREIQDATPHGKNIYLCKTTADMVRTAIRRVDWIDSPEPKSSDGWDEAADALASGIDMAISRLNFGQLCRRLRRLENHRLISNSHRQPSRNHAANSRVSDIITGSLAAHFEDAESRFQWLRELTVLLARLPVWWSLMPTQWRRRRKNKRLSALKLFDADAYLTRYPDVAESGMDPLDHYIRHGIGEGRLID